MKRSLVRPLLALTMFSLCAELFAVENGRASGKVVINGQQRSVKFAYAKKVKSSEGDVEYHVLLTDRALFPSVLADEFRHSEILKADGGTILKLTWLPDKTLQQAYVQDGSMDRSGVPMSSSDVTAALSSLGGSIAGKAKTNSEQDFFDNTAAFDVAFSATVGDEKFGANLAAQKELEPKFSKIAVGRAEGTLTVAGQKTALSHVYAVTAPGAFDEKKRDTIVVLSDKPIEDALLADTRKLSDAGSRGKFQGLIITINEEEQPYSTEVLHYEGQTSSMGSGYIGYESLTFDGKAAVGRVFTREPKRLQGKKTYEFDVSYRAAVRTLEPPREEGLVDAKNGTRLPAGGGEPGKAYLAFDKALRSGNINDIKKFVPVDGGGMPPLDPKDPETKEMIEFLQMMQPKDLKITEGWIAGDEATLTVVGDGGQSTGTILMKKEQGSWRIRNQSWKSVSK